ncbi:MAG: glycosyltransferase family 39 protein [Anaerolineaceae bacterium]|nr:glycosyltransferase family 39 protein [Anaerolineaceae bacterium]
MSGPMPVTPTQPVERPFHRHTRWLTAGSLVALMTLLQLGWLAAIWLTGATEATYKLLPLIMVTVGLGTIIYLLPERYLAWLPLDEDRLARMETRVLLLAGLLLGATLLIFASQQHLWAFDEKGNLTASYSVARKGVLALFENYDRRPWLGKQHPPLVPIIYGTAMRLLGPTQLAGRLITAVFAMSTGWLTYLIGRRLFNRQTALLGALLLFSFPLVLRLGSAAMVEMPLTFFFTLTVWLTLRVVERPSWDRWLLVGLVVAAGLLSKYTMVFVLPLVVGIVAVRGSKKQALCLAGAGVLAGGVLVTGFVVVASRVSVLQQQLATMREYAGLVLTNEYGRRVLLETITNRLPSALGVYNLPLLALGGLFTINRRRPVDWVVLLWILSVWLPLFLTLPDHRYFLPSFPAVAMLAALGLQQISRGTARGLLLSLLFAASTLYLYVDWVRSAALFVK